MPLLVLSGIIPLVLMAIFYATEIASKKITAEAEANLKLQSKLLAENVQAWNESNILALLNLSKQPDIVHPNPTQQKIILSEIVNTYHHLYLARTINLHGWNIARNDKLKPKYYGDRNYFKNAILGKKINYETIISRTNSKPALCISTPTYKQDHIIGVTSLCTNLNALAKQVGKLRFGRTGYAFIVDNNGNILAHYNEQLLSGEKLINISEYPPVKNILADNLGDFTFEDKNQVKWVSYSNRLNNGWSIVIVQEEAEFLNGKTQFQNLALLISFVVVFGVISLTWFVAHQLIKPISYLSSAATNIAEGQLNQKVEIDQEDELGTLALSFNRMATQLQIYFEELKQAREEAIAANLAKDKLIANISHEFRTPLNSVLGYAKILHKDRSLDSEQVHKLNNILRSGTYLLNLINDILDISKSKIGKINLNVTEFEFPNFLNSLIDIVESSAREKRLQLRTEFNNIPTTIKSDQKRLAQVLLNLLSNAIKFTSSGEIVLKVSNINNINAQLPKKLRFEIIDTGTGLSEKEIGKIFNPFEQAGDIKSRYLGTGLGLTISKQLVELMGGKLQVKTKLGKGSNFWFEIVCSQEKFDSKRSIKQRMPIILGYKGKKLKLLVVDDQRENLLLLENILEPLGFIIVTANNGDEMLNIVAQEKPDLICLDLFMPVKTGLTSAKQLQKIPEFSNIPIIIISASSITKEMQDYLNCEAFLSKPLEEEKLLELLQKYLHLEWIYRQEDREIKEAKIEKILLDSSDVHPKVLNS